MGAMTMAAALLLGAAAAPPSPAASEAEVWALASRIGSSEAYATYLERFPDGGHSQEALEAYSRIRNMPIVHAPPAPPPPPAPQPFSRDPCREILVAQEMRKKDDREARQFIAARNTNRPADFQAFLARFPDGVCAPRATDMLRMRETLRRRYKPIAGFGPLAPHRLSSGIFTNDDYPAQALRREESGRVSAEWEVAADGLVENCRITVSSGSASLDSTTCRLITMRMRYDPARDSSGAAIRSADRLSITWVLPSEPLPTPPDTQ